MNTHLAPYAYKILKREKVLVLYVGYTNNPERPMEYILNRIEQQNQIDRREYTILKSIVGDTYEIAAISESGIIKWDRFCMDEYKKLVSGSHIEKIRGIEN